jgi:hypothetical protein
MALSLVCVCVSVHFARVSFLWENGCLLEEERRNKQERESSETTERAAERWARVSKAKILNAQPPLISIASSGFLILSLSLSLSTKFTGIYRV